jgi:hypothetical protein
MGISTQRPADPSPQHYLVLSPSQQPPLIMLRGVSLVNPATDQDEPGMDANETFCVERPEQHRCPITVEATLCT